MGMLNPDIPDTPAVNNSLDALEQSIEEVRRLGRSLNSDTWQNKSLRDALEAEGVRLERTGRTKVDVNLAKNVPDLEPDAKTILFRCCQEVLSNALRHSGAKHISIALTADPTYTLTIADDGKGFDPTASSAGSGVLNIKKRCAMIGFDAQLDTAEGRGCRWSFVTSLNNS
jgi:signal transduction histidine kinase